MNRVRRWLVAFLVDVLVEVQRRRQAQVRVQVDGQQVVTALRKYRRDHGGQAI